MINPLISVIIPIYNAEKYLDRCIHSVVNQTYKNLEIILINDGSDDSSGGIVDLWAQKDERIKAVHKSNEGDVATRNKGLDMFSGEYVVMIDNDDYIEPDMIEFLYNLIIETDADISRCGFYREYVDKSVVDEQSFSDELTVLDNDDFDKKIIDLLVSDHYSGVVWNKLFKRNVIENHRMNKQDGAADDFIFNYRIIEDNPKLVLSVEPKYHYLIRDDSMTGKTFTEGAFDIVNAKKMLLHDFADNVTVYPYAVKSFIISAFIVLTGCINNSYFNDSYKSLIQTMISFYPYVKNSPMFSKSEKLKLFTLKYFPKLYHCLIRKKYGKKWHNH